MPTEIPDLPTDNVLLQASLSGGKAEDIDPASLEILKGRRLNDFVKQRPKLELPLPAFDIGAADLSNQPTPGGKTVDATITYGGRKDPKGETEILKSFAPEAVIANVTKAGKLEAPRDVSSYPLLELWQLSDAVVEITDRARKNSALKEALKGGPALDTLRNDLDELIAELESAIVQMEQRP